MFLNDCYQNFQQAITPELTILFYCQFWIKKVFPLKIPYFSLSLIFITAEKK